MIKTKDIIKSCLKGDRTAFALLVDHYKSFVCSLAYCTTGSVEESEDIGRCVFTNVWQNFSSLSEVGRFNLWLAGITLTTIAAHINRENKQPAYTSPETGDLINFTPLPTDPTDAAMAKDENMILWQTLKSLPLECRETFVLYYRYEKSVKHVAELLSITEQAVSQRLSHARQMLTEKTERRLETSIRNTSPNEKFTAMVIAAVSTIPAGISHSQKISGGNLFSSLLSSPAGKIAAAAAIIMILTGIIIITGKQTPAEPVLTPQPTTHKTEATLPPQVHKAQAEQPQATPQIPRKKQLNQMPAPVIEAVEEEAPVTETPAEEEPVVMFEGVLSGRITDMETGQPVENASIAMTLPDGSVNSTHTNQDGYYKFDTLDVYGHCTIAVTAKDYAGINCAYGNSISLDLDPDTQNVQHIELQKACILEIEVTDEDGRAITDARIEMTNSADPLPQGCANPNQGRTGADGKLLLSGIKPSNANYILTISPPKENCYITRILTIALSYPNGIEKCKIALSKGCLIEGYVYDNYGVPRTGLKLNLYNSPADDGDDVRNISHTVTDELGYYRFECMPEQPLYIKTPSYDDGMGICRICVFPNKNEPIILNIGGGTFVSGKLILGSQPLANCKLFITDTTDFNSAAFISSGRTDENGSFMFSGIPQEKKFLVCEYENRHIVIAEIDTYNHDLNLGDMNFESFDNTATHPDNLPQ